MGECVYMCGWMVTYIWNGQEYMELLSACLFPSLISMLLLLNVCMLTPTCMVVGVKCGEANASWLVIVAGPIFSNQLAPKCHMRLSGLFNSCSKSALAGISEDSFQRSHASKRFLAGARFVNKVPGEASDWENSECELLTIDHEFFGGKDNKECRQ